jgi:hypothetical protein
MSLTHSLTHLRAESQTEKLALAMQHRAARSVHGWPFGAEQFPQKSRVS